MSTDAAAYVFVLLLIGITMVAVRSSYPILRFFAGTIWWGFGVWLIYNPIESAGSPVNNIMLTICFFGGLAMMLMMAWRGDSASEGRFNIRIPSIFGGKTEDEERSQLDRADWRKRRAAYRDRLDRALRGRR